MSSSTSLVGQALTSSSGSSSSSSTTMSEQLVEAYKKQQQSRLDAITAKKTSSTDKQNLYKTVQTKLNSLDSELDNYTASDGGDLFKARSTTVSDTDVMAVETKAAAPLGTTTVRVNRLATNDSFVSTKATLSDTCVTADSTFTFDVGTESKHSSVTVKFSAGDTYLTALTKLTKAINADSADNIGVSANVIKDTSTTGRLALTADDTGTDGRILFSTTSGTNPFEKLGLTDSMFSSSTGRTISSTTSAGFSTADVSNLQSEIVVNGITVTRGSNSISDVVDNLTFKLKATQASTDNAINLVTTVDATTLAKNIQPLLDSYNDIITSLKGNAILRSETSLSTLYSTLRSSVGSKVTSVANDEYNYLSDVGIKVKSDGTLYIYDKDQLETAAQDNPDQVYNLFCSSDGMINKFSNTIKNYIGSSGIVTTKITSLSKTLKEISDKYDKVSAQIDKEAESTRKQYESMEKVYLQATSQYSSYSSMMSSSSSSY